MAKQTQKQKNLQASEDAWTLAIESYQEDYSRLPLPSERFVSKNNRQRMLELCTLKYEQEN